MPRFAKILLWWLLLFPPALRGQDDSDPPPQQGPTFVHIGHVFLEGNRRTRPAWILRELDFAPGDSLPMEALGLILERNSRLLMNTGLFMEAKINLRNWTDDNRADAHISLREAWYFFPVPAFSLADRNINVWWRDFDHDLRRVNLGLNLYHFNLTGRNDEARATVQLGYAQKFQLTYDRPGINRRQTLGLTFGALYSRQRETFYLTEGNRLRFHFDNEHFMLQRLRLSAALTWRPGLFTWHTLTLERHDNRVADIVAKELNPDFFLNGSARQQHWSLVFNLSHDRRDIRPYPLRGWRCIAEVRRNGLLPSDDFHLFRALAELDKYFSFSRRWSLETISAVRVSLPRQKIPYFNDQALGYDNYFVRGYEYYVADGLDFYLLKTGLHFQLLNRTTHLGKFMPMKNYRLFPLKAYLALNNDFGYAREPHYAAGNPLANTLLHGHGLGLDLVAYYTRVVRLEWSVNARGESGFFLRFRANF